MRRCLAVLAVACVGCSAPDPAPPSAGTDPACTVGLDVDTSGWAAVVEQDFAFRLPPGFAEDSVRGIDSYVRQWSDAAGAVLTFDYGWYSSTLDEFRGNAQASDCHLEVGGRSAYLAMARGFPGDPRTESGWVVGITWRDVRQGDMATHLTMFGSAPDSAGAASLLAAMRTTVFQIEH